MERIGNSKIESKVNQERKQGNTQRNCRNTKTDMWKSFGKRQERGKKPVNQVTEGINIILTGKMKQLDFCNFTCTYFA